MTTFPTFLKTTLFSTLALLVSAALARPAAATELKIATLAPSGSAWAKIMEKGAKNVGTTSAGRVTVKYFFNGQQGDERDVVRKMTGGQLDGAALTAVGLGLIVKDVRVLELPAMFKTDKELDYVRDRLRPDFEAQFEKAGYKLISWGDVGWVHMLSNTELKSRADIGKTKMWAWTDDVIVRELFKRLGVNGVPLGVPEVLPALQTGLIDACYGSPLAAVALQWYKKVKFASAQPLSYAIGAYVIRKDVFERLAPADQQLLVEGGRTMGAELMKNVRKDNDRAAKAMQKAGITFVQAPPALVAELEKGAHEVWQALIGKVYPKELLAKVIATRDACKCR